MFRHTTAHSPKAQFMLNKFAHYSEHEFREMYLNKKMPQDFKFDPKIHSMLPEVSKEKIAALPKSFDWCAVSS